MGVLKKAVGAVRGGFKHMGTDPVGWAKNALVSPLNPIGFAAANGDKYLFGRSGSFNSVMRNPYYQAGAGIALSMAGAPIWAAPVAGGGMSALGGGNLEDDLRGASMSSLGYGAGNLGQSAYAGWQGAGAAAAPGYAEGGASYYGAEPVASSAGASGAGLAGGASNAGNVAVNWPAGAESMGYASPTAAATEGPAVTAMNAGNVAANWPGGVEESASPVLRSAETGGASAYSVPAEPTLGQRAMSAARSASLTNPAGGSSFLPSGNTMGAVMGAKAGLGVYQNLQQQKYLEDEVKRRKRNQEWVDNALANPASVYANDPALVAGRQRAMSDLDARYRAKYGGTEGGAFAADLIRTGSEYDNAALDRAINRRLGIVESTAPAYYQNLAAGGTRGGALAGPVAQAIPDYLFYQWLGGQ
jgi:hypothetical protein